MSAATLVVHCDQLWTPTGFQTQRSIIIQAGKIQALVAPSQAPADAIVLDARDAIAIPGLVDIQVNGALGWSFQAQHRDHYADILRYHAHGGTTTLLPTIITAPAATLRESLATLAAYRTGPELATVSNTVPMTLPGVHLEGPFLAPAKSGAHDPDALSDPSLDLMQEFVQAANGALKLVTLAPELPGSLPVIEYLHRQGIIVCAGHTAATYTDLQRAKAAGLRFITHAGNASDWPHRAPGPLGFMASEPGVVGTLLADPDFGAGIILDGYHFHPALLAPLVQLRGDRIVLTSDASTVAGCPPGDYEGGGLRVTIHPQGFALSGFGGGWLAGSTIRLIDAVRRAVTLAGLPLHQAVTLASAAPAKLLGLSGQKGTLQPGADADLLLLDADLNLQTVIVKGRVLPTA